MGRAPEDKGLPINTEAERYVLGAILLDEKLYFEVAAILEADDFSLEKHRRIFKRMGELQGRGEHIDRITVANELGRYGELDSVDGLSYLVSLDDGLPATPHVDSYCREVKEKSIKRRLIFSSQHVINRCMMDEESSQSILTDTRDSLLTMGTVQDDDGPQTPEQIIMGLPGQIAEFLGPRKQGLRTGFIKYDEMTGGLHPGQLTILAARPGVGKSAMALNIAQEVALKQKKTVMLFSLEMSKEELLHRAVCSIAKVDSQRVRLNYLNADERRRLRVATDELMESELYIDDESAATVAGMHGKVHRRMAKGPVHLVIVDYLQLMSAGRNFESRNQEVTSISRGMKLMTGEIHAPLLVLSQLNRAPELRKGNNRPQLSDLRDSGSVEQDADVVSFIFREEMYRKDREDLRGQAELIVGKQRQGPTGTVHLVFLHQTTTFCNRAEDSGYDEDPLPMFGSQEDADN